jgi:hypothetical protein
MRRAAKVGLTIVAAAAALPLAALAYLALTFGWPLPDCGAQSPAVAKARQLSQSQLARLHAEMSDLARRDPGAHSISAELWPSTIAALQPKKVSADLSPRITLEGCFDHYVFLKFEGTSSQLGPGQPRILLSWGEGPDAGEETLWQL